MKMLLEVDLPPEPFNSLARSGEVGGLLGRILESVKPETAYFTEHDGKRGGIFVVDIQKPSDIPLLAEPFYLNFQAGCRFRVAMSPEDLKNAGLDELAKQWG